MSFLINSDEAGDAGIAKPVFFVSLWRTYFVFYQSRPVVRYGGFIV